MNERDELRSIVRCDNQFRHLDLFEKIHIVGWFIHRFHQKKYFTEEDIRRCLDHLDIQVATYRPIIPDSAQIIKSHNGYRVNWNTLGELDARYKLLLAQTEVHNLLKELPAKLSLKDEKSYLEETITCYTFGAHRAAIVMCWNLVYSHLCNFILTDPSKLDAFSKTLSRQKDTIKVYDDFLRLREADVIESCNTARIIGKNQYTILKEKLNRRNMAAHPSNITIEPEDVEHYIRDSINNVLLKLA
jgi:hypothetical protein